MLIPAKDSIDLGVIVKDIQASLNFYQNVLGLPFVEKITLPLGTMHRLRFGTSDFKLIEPKQTPPSASATGLYDQYGFRYVTFVVKNLSAICLELTKIGVEFVTPEREIRPGVRIAMVKDPDGNVVEFVERG